MANDRSPPVPPSLHGLDPGKLLDILEVEPPVPPLIPGWQVAKLVGKGGFGHVWKAVREKDGAVAAVKIASTEDPDTLERIEHEAGVLKTLDHPHVVRLLDSGSLGGEERGIFLAMEFIDGASLSDEIPPGGMEPGRVFRLFGEIASAVSAAHDASVLHRDLKPSNVLLDEDGRAKLADFGLALPIHRRVQQLSLTRAGLVAGTAEYLPPEAYRRDYRPDVAGDVFALGIILYEMLTGSPPRGAWQPASSQPGVDVRIDGIIRRAIDPDPGKRWKDAAAMARALEGVATSQPRYSGAPVLSFPIQMTDFIWTLNGLFLLIASVSSLLVLMKSKFILPFDFVNPYGELAGAFHALFWLLFFSIPVSVWQIVRLGIFRHVPMREGLPLPFGLKLGTGKTAVALVCITQVCCVLLPAMNFFYIYTDGCLQWLRPDSPPWVHGLSMARWGETEMLSIWMLPEAGKDYWLTGSFGPPGHPLSETVSRLHFLPAYVPGLMVFCAVLLLSAILATAVFAGKRWLVRGRRKGALILCAAGMAAVFLFSRIHAMAQGHAERELNIPAQNWGKSQMLRRVSVMLEHILRGTADGSAPTIAPEMLRLYAGTVDYRKSGSVPREEIPNQLASQPYLPCKRVCHPEDNSVRLKADQVGFTISRSATVYTDPLDPASPSGAVIAKLSMEGRVHDRERIEITRERYTEMNLYTAANRSARPEEIEAWVEEFSAALGSPDLTALRGLFHPMEKSGKKLGVLLSSLEDARTFELDRSPHLVRSLPGGRSLVRLEMKDPATGDFHRWQAELALIGGSWKCLHLGFGN